MEGLSAEPAKWPSRKKTMVDSLAFLEGSTASLASTAAGVAAELAAAGCCCDRAETGIRSNVARGRWMRIRISPRKWFDYSQKYREAEGGEMSSECRYAGVSIGRYATDRFVGNGLQGSLAGSVERAGQIRKTQP